MALAQLQTTPSSFDNNLKWNITNISSFSMRESGNDYSALSITFFNKDNQKPTSGYTPSNGLLFPRVIPQEKLIELEEYRGFSFMKRGEIAVSYNKDDIDFLYNFKFVCLNRQEHNDYYPEPYLVICFELELEGSGVSEEAAFNDLYQLINIYFNQTREIYKNPIEYVNFINENITQQNPWKLSFDRTYKLAQKLGIINTDYHHQITEEYNAPN
jgi:hypothetical protein